MVYNLLLVCRMTSNFLPWCTSYDMEDLPDFPAIADELAFAGKLARAYQQRLTFHPSHFVKVAAPSVTKKSKEGELLQRSLKELEVHSQVIQLGRSFASRSALFVNLLCLNWDCCAHARQHSTYGNTANHCMHACVQ